MWKIFEFLSIWFWENVQNMWVLRIMWIIVSIWFWENMQNMWFLENMWFFKNVNFTGDINDRAWCSTSTDQDHTHQAGSNTWGYCDPELCWAPNQGQNKGVLQVHFFWKQAQLFSFLPCCLLPAEKLIFCSYIATK